MYHYHYYHRCCVSNLKALCDGSGCGSAGGYGSGGSYGSNDRGDGNRSGGGGVEVLVILVNQILVVR